MSEVIIRNFGDGLMRRLTCRAEERGHSVEDTVRELVQHALVAEEVGGPRRSQLSIGEQIHSIFASMGGVELDIPPREQPRQEE